MSTLLDSLSIVDFFAGIGDADDVGKLHLKKLKEIASSDNDRMKGQMMRDFDFHGEMGTGGQMDSLFLKDEIPMFEPWDENYPSKAYEEKIEFYKNVDRDEIFDSQKKIDNTKIAPPKPPEEVEKKRKRKRKEKKNTKVKLVEMMDLENDEIVEKTKRRRRRKNEVKVKHRPRKQKTPQPSPSIIQRTTEGPIFYCRNKFKYQTHGKYGICTTRTDIGRSPYINVPQSIMGSGKFKIWVFATVYKKQKQKQKQKQVSNDFDFVGDIPLNKELFRITKIEIDKKEVRKRPRDGLFIKFKLDFLNQNTKLILEQMKGMKNYNRKVVMFSLIFAGKDDGIMVRFLSQNDAGKTSMNPKKQKYHIEMKELVGLEWEKVNRNVVGDYRYGKLICEYDGKGQFITTKEYLESEKQDLISPEQLDDTFYDKIHVTDKKRRTPLKIKKEKVEEEGYSSEEEDDDGDYESDDDEEGEEKKEVVKKRRRKRVGRKRKRIEIDDDYTDDDDWEEALATTKITRSRKKRKIR